MIRPATRAQMSLVRGLRGAVARSAYSGSTRRFYSEKNDIFTLDIDVEPTKPQKPPKPTKSPAKDDTASAKPQDTAKEIDDIFSDLFGSSQPETNETSSGLDSIFDDMARSSPEPEHLRTSGKDILKEEADLFSKIFKTYNKAEPEYPTSSKLHKQVLSTLQNSFSTVSPGNAAGSLKTLPEKQRHSLQEETRKALQPTMAYIENLESRAELEQFARRFLGSFRQNDASSGNFYLRKLKKESMEEYLARQKSVCGEIGEQCTKDPSSPPLNATTMPLVFNQLISVVSNKFRDGALALTLFNAVKEDLHLYTVVCNQQTYNEMLKVHWMYFGKASLCEVELLVVEMMNNGFAGDYVTFAVLREILHTYHSMRSGKSIYNPGGVPIWAREDEQRARNLGDKLEKLGRQLKKERFMRG